MGLISRLFNFTAGTTIVADQVDAEFDQILGVLNGNVEAANIKDGTVGKAELATDALNNFLKLAVAGDHKVEIGHVAVPAAFNGNNRMQITVNHDLGVAPTSAFGIAGYIAGASTSTGQNEAITVSKVSATSTQITFELVLTNGATAAVGASSFDWLAYV